MILGLLIAFILVVFIFVLIERFVILHRYASTPDWINPDLIEEEESPDWMKGMDEDEYADWASGWQNYTAQLREEE
tara:strand:+ start:115 stop:342 length:228 start_codon:yes stop_codon:yes gene_type:complete